MTVPLYCLATMMLITIFTKFPVAVAMAKKPERYDNRHPRFQQASLTGWGARALAAHHNSFEALILFTPAVVISQFTGAPETSSIIANLAMTFVIARVIYPVLYIADLHIARSLVWTIGFLSAVIMAFYPLFQ